MNKLLIHNQDTIISDPHIFSTAEQFVFELDDEFPDVDHFMSYLLTDGDLKNKVVNTDIIFIRLSLSSNYLEYLGIRLAYHIRMTLSLSIKRFVPIVLVGEESYRFLGITSELSEILFTEGIYLMKDTKEDFEKYAHSYTNGRLSLLSSEKKFIEKIRIPAPANYNSHHSIANEWSILRWAEMGKNISEELRLAIHLKNTSSNTLYFKYLEAKYLLNTENPRQQFKRDNARETLIIPYLKSVKIYYIDDEADKGWGALFTDGIFKDFVSNDAFDFYKDFKKGEKKETQLSKLKLKINDLIKNDGYNVFIIDLRLFDEDFIEGAAPSGLELISEIEKINKGVQIVVFTASKKAENFQKTQALGVESYVFKESPENVLSRNESMEVFVKFSNAVKKAMKYSILTSVYTETEVIRNLSLFSTSKEAKEIGFINSTIKKNGFLDKIFALLSSKNGALTEFALLTCFNMLEKFCDLYYVSQNEGTGLVILSTETTFCHFRDSTNSINTCIEFQRSNYPFEINQDGSTPVTAVFHKTLQLRTKGAPGGGTRGLVRLLAVLKYRFELSDERLNELMKMKYLRNNLAAHDTGKIDKDKRTIKIEDVIFLLDIFKEIALFQIKL